MVVMGTKIISFIHLENSHPGPVPEEPSFHDPDHGERAPAISTVFLIDLAADPIAPRRPEHHHLGTTPTGPAGDRLRPRETSTSAHTRVYAERLIRSRNRPAAPALVLDRGSTQAQVLPVPSQDLRVVIGEALRVLLRGRLFRGLDVLVVDAHLEDAARGLEEFRGLLTAAVDEALGGHHRAHTGTMPMNWSIA